MEENSEKIPLTDVMRMLYEGPQHEASDAQGGVEVCGCISENREEIKSAWGGSRPGAGRKPKSETQPKPFASGMRWYAVEAHARQTDRALRSILNGTDKRKPFQAFLPKIAVRKRVTVAGVRRGQMETVLAPLLYSFFFVKFDVNAPDWSAIRYAEGVRRILTTASGRPVPVETGLVERLIKTAKVREAIPDVKMARLKPGTFACVVSRDPAQPHAFDGQVVEVVRCDGNVTVAMVRFLGGQREANFRRFDLVDE